MKRAIPCRAQNGSAAIEFALVLPLLISLVFGIVEVGLLLYNYAMLTNASRVGARAAIAGKTDAADMVKAYCNGTPEIKGNLLSLGKADNLVKDGDIAVVNNVAIPGSAKNGARVTVSFNHQFLFGQLFGISNAVKPLTASTVMRLE